jgi:hypothetical protein
MDANVGDRLVVEGKRVGDHRRCGTIVEVVGHGVERHYRVRWDDGHESSFFPAGGAGTISRRSSEPFSDSTQVVVRITEDDYETEATATLSTAVGPFTGHGRARRNPVDPQVPLVGEELALARALVDLADKLSHAAGSAIGSGVPLGRHLVP